MLLEIFSAKYWENKNSLYTGVIPHHLAFIPVVTVQFSVVPMNE